MIARPWLTLSLTDGIGPILARRMIAAAGSIHAACDADARLLQTVDGIGQAKASKIAASLREAKAKVDDVAAKTNAALARVICPDDDVYPLLLKTIPDPPLVLFVRGTIEPRDLNAVAIVGSRKCSLYGREQAERFAALLAGAGFTVVSGGARGVDSAAHRGAGQHTSGRTIAVLGSGVDIAYPPENAGLFNQITTHGCVMSEFPPGTPPTAENFPRRNRIVSGMSRGVLVIEADERSGALITARQAVEEHHRPVMCVPGRADNPQSAGPHKLIREGAVLVTRLEHVLEALGPLDASIPEMPLFEGPDEAPIAPPPSAKAQAAAVSPSQRVIFDVLSADPMDVDTLCEQTSMDAGTVLRELTFLSLKGLVRRLDGQRFAKTR
ncbi:MAG: Rossmann fold nucleotide-binding protein Smf [Phycisphaerales bacterium]|nr:Rossmann fold nucleotide-binding protein Smf [Phycisphaerales bacterium]